MDQLKKLDQKNHAIKWQRENMMKWFRIELTYTSNALEGSTFTRHETAVFLQKEITIGGKTLKEHVEVTNHARAFDYIVELSQRIKSSEISEENILNIHEKILTGLGETQNYRTVPVRIVGSNSILPNYQKVPTLMKDLVHSIQNSSFHPIQLAIDVHYHFVTIHPFTDGNGRTGRLLMNLILLIHKYPPMIIKKSSRLQYIKTLEKAQTIGDLKEYNEFMLKAFDQTLDICLKTDSHILPLQTKLLRISELAQKADTPISTIRHWLKEGLIQPRHISESGYQFFDQETLNICKQITKLKNERYTIGQIKTILA